MLSRKRRTVIAGRHAACHLRQRPWKKRSGQTAMYLPQDEIVALGDMSQVIRVSARLLVAALLGALLGIEREKQRKAAGLRTHMIVAMGSAMFIVVPLE